MPAHHAELETNLADAEPFGDKRQLPCQPKDRGGVGLRRLAPDSQEPKTPRAHPTKRIGGTLRLEGEGVRRLDQVLYDLISDARFRIVLVTFAAHRVRYLCNHLIQAVDRGVELTLIVESEDESEGQLTHDAVAAFRDVPAAKIHLFYWPLAKRERNQAGRPGKLHMKCAIVDDVALIGSANLTDDAFNRNMELGMLVREKATVETLSGHFRELVRAKILVPVQPRETTCP